MELDLFEPSYTEEALETAQRVSTGDVRRMLARKRLEMHAEAVQLEEHLYDVLGEAETKGRNARHSRHDVH